MTLVTSITLSVSAALSAALDLVAAQAPLAYRNLTSLLSGVGAGQADRIFSDTRTLAASTTEDLDLSGGGLLDALGNVLVFARLKAIIVVADPLNTNNVVLGGDAASVPFLGTPATTVTLKPGGVYCQIDPSAAGIVVTATTFDIIQVANSGAGTGVNYSIILIGCSA